MKNPEKYDELVKKYLAEYKITNCLITDGLVKLDIIPERGWGKCTFIFTGHHIICFGDVQTYSWHCTWDTAKEIVKGSCNARDFIYLSSKLEHRSELMEFVFSDETMEKIKEEIIGNNAFDEDELKDFNEKWEENYYMVGEVDKYRLDGLDEFFSEMEVDDAYEYYHYFEDYPTHYYCAMAMLKCIEDHFGKEKQK